MVKNHALKNAARARKAETGETLPEAMRMSAKGTEAKPELPVVHLGSGIYFDMNRESPHLRIVGASNSGKTQLVRQILNELEGFDVDSTLLSAESHETLTNPRVVQIQANGKKYNEVLESLSNMCRAGTPLDKPMVLIMDELTELSDEASIYLQMIYKWGSDLGVRVISTAFDKSVVPSVIRANSSLIEVHHGGYGTLEHEEFFRIGAPKRAVDTANGIELGSEASWSLDNGSLMILGAPGSGKTVLAQDMARQALMNGTKVTVMTNQGSQSEWEEVFGNAISLTDEMSRSTMNALIASDASESKRLLIVDGLPASYADSRGMTINEQLAMSSLVSFIQGGHCPTVVIGHSLPWFSILFRSFVLKRNFEGTGRIQTSLGVSVPKDVDLLGLSYDEGYLLDMDAKQAPPIKFSHGM
jgi:adenylate kinase family enzyme